MPRFQLTSVPVGDDLTLSLPRSNEEGLLDLPGLPLVLHSKSACLIPFELVLAILGMFAGPRLFPSPMENVFLVFFDAGGYFLFGLSNLHFPAIARK